MRRFIYRSLALSFGISLAHGADKAPWYSPLSTSKECAQRIEFRPINRMGQEFSLQSPIPKPKSFVEDPAKSLELMISRDSAERMRNGENIKRIHKDGVEGPSECSVQ